MKKEGKTMKKETIIEIYTRFKNGDSHYLSIPELLYLTEKLKTDDTIISKYISFNLLLIILLSSFEKYEILCKKRRP